MQKCRCGSPKPKRFKVCKACFSKMSAREKQAYASKSREKKDGTLRRW